MPFGFEQKQAERNAVRPTSMYDAMTCVEVIAHVSSQGVITPLSIRWEDGRNYKIGRVLRADRLGATKAGGWGVRYKVWIGGREMFLYFHESRWFVERK